MKNATAGHVTLQDVAQEAGVSLATASRAVNGSDRKVRQDLQERVLEAAARLNYAANGPAQAMARGRTDVVGLIVHDISDPYFSAIASGVMRAADHEGLLVTLGSTMGRSEKELDYLQALRGQRSRAVILAGSRVADEDLLARLRDEAAAFERAGGRVVVISQHKLPLDTVVVENRSGAKALAMQLAPLGYRRVAILAGPARLLTSSDRTRGLQDGFAASGVPAPTVIETAFTRDGGYAAMQELLRQGSDVDCVVAVNDVMAVGAMAACRDAGLTLPRDLALAGFDDIATLRDVHPKLTTVQLPLERMGELALELVASATLTTPHRTRRVRGHVLVRESTPALSPS